MQKTEAEHRHGPNAFPCCKRFQVSGFNSQVKISPLSLFVVQRPPKGHEDCSLKAFTGKAPQGQGVWEPGNAAGEEPRPIARNPLRDIDRRSSSSFPHVPGGNPEAFKCLDPVEHRAGMTRKQQDHPIPCRFPVRAHSRSSSAAAADPEALFGPGPRQPPWSAPSPGRPPPVVRAYLRREPDPPCSKR